MRVNKDLRTLYIIVALVAVILCIFSPITETADTQSYYDAWNNMLAGHIDKKRTPLYPAYLGFFQTIFGAAHFKLPAVLGQLVVFLLSVGVFHRLARIFTKSGNIAFWTTLCYSLLCTLSWCYCLLTESFAISGMVFLVYSVYKLHDHYSLKWAVITSLIIIGLVFLRPAFVYIFPVLGLVWLISAFSKARRKQAIAGLLGLVAAVAVLFSYMYAFKQAYGVFAVSSISYVNKWYIARQCGILDPSVIENPQLRAEMEESIKLHGEMYEGALGKDYDDGLLDEKGHVFDTYDLPTIKQAIDASLKSHPLQSIAKSFKRYTRSSSQNAFISYNEGSLSALTVYPLTFFSVRNIFVFLILFGIFLLVKWYVNKKLPWLTATCYLFALANMMLVFVGAQAEWGRLFAPSYSIIYLLIGQLCSLMRPAPIKDMEMP